VTAPFWLFPRIEEPDQRAAVPNQRVEEPDQRAAVPDLPFAAPDSVRLASAPALFEEAQHFVLRIPLTPQAR
jgi:hypothetical protein